ncbi:MAG: HD-GYP domain-containing protein [Lachnospiraceae bacterium]|nr:HD-GYP domain-containing protein [Lachnospiraceae bacterium]
MDMLKELQLDLMIALIGIGIAFAILIVLAKGISRKRRLVIVIIELLAAALLSCDRLAYIYDGDPRETGRVIVYVSNYLLYLLTPLCAFVFDHYIMNLFREDLNLKIPKRLWAACAISAAAAVFVVIFSLIPEFLFYVDSANRYSRGQAYIICYILPTVSILIMISVVVQNRKHFSSHIYYSLLLFLIGPVVASVAQAFTYGFSLGDMAIMITSILVYIFAYLDINEKAEILNRSKIEHLEEQRRLSQRLFEQTATVLANAIDAKDVYTRGHSLRVAEYSEKIARRLGKDEEFCRQIYYTGLLHDVGKIGISDHIITKKGKLTDEEYSAMKQHPVIGSQILSGIRDYPYLGIGAHYHHERYDGKGYPNGLIGEEIPEIARIISVADAYDAMTSNRSYRAAIPQQIVREEILKNSGTQFDPDVAKAMQYLIDVDGEYQMKERTEATGLSGASKLKCDDYESAISEGILVTPQEVTIYFRHESDGTGTDADRYPTIILFDSLDAHFYRDERAARDLSCLEYGRIRLNGIAECEAARKMDIRGNVPAKPAGGKADPGPKATEYVIKAVRLKDHAKIMVDNGKETYDVIVAFPDSTRYAYIGLTGAHCVIDSVRMERSEENAQPGSIPRIAEEISFIKENEGDIPNVQVDTFRSDASCGTEITDGMKMTFHSMSLPSARLIWHCPYIVIFHSDDGLVNGKNYREYALVRLDGEYWDGVDVKNTAHLTKLGFQGWEAWKKGNREGIDVEVTFACGEDWVRVKTSNLGITLENTTKINNISGTTYVALSGDQCAITNIRFTKNT